MPVYVLNDSKMHELVCFYYTKRDFDGIVDNDLVRFTIDYDSGWFDHTDVLGRRDCGYSDDYIGKKNALALAKKIIKEYGRARDKKKQFSQDTGR